MKDEETVTEPYITLKFGGIKSMNFDGNPEAMQIADGADLGDIPKQIEIIKAYSGKFFIWWEQRDCTKEEAIEYILNYER